MTQATTPAAFTDEPMPLIPLTPVKSNQVAAIGYDPLTKTLAVTFTRGTGAVYHYPNVEPKVHQDFMAAESIGKYFGAHIKALPFKKFAAPKAEETKAENVAPPRGGSSSAAWPFPTAS